MEGIVIDSVRPREPVSDYVTHGELADAIEALESRLMGQTMNNGNNVQMDELKRDPISVAKKKGFQIPDNLAGNPQAMVMHLINSGQVSSPMLQKIMPMMQKLGWK